MKVKKIDYTKWDPYKLNDCKDQEWTYNRARLDFLQKLAKEDTSENNKTWGHLKQMIIEKQKQKEEAQNKNNDKKKENKGVFAKIKKAFKHSDNRDKKVEYNDIYAIGDLNLRNNSEFQSDSEPLNAGSEHDEYKKQRDRQAEIMEEMNEGKIYDPELEVEEQINKARSFISLC